MEINKTNCFNGGKRWETFMRFLPGYVTKCIRLIPTSLFGVQALMITMCLVKMLFSQGIN